MLKNAGDHIAITFGAQKLTYRQFFGKIDLFAGLCNVKPTDRVVVFSENRPAWIFAFYSVWKKQAIPVPIDYMATASEVAYIIGDCAPELIFCSKSTAETMHKAMASASSTARLIVLDEFENSDTPELETNGLPEIAPEETAVIIYTSGTTGSPKGVMLSFANIINNVDAVSKHIPIYNSESHVLALLPFHHVFPLVGTMIITLYLGAMVAISQSMASEDIMKTLQDNKVTIIIGVPRLYAAIRKGVMDKINQSFVARLLFSLANKLNSKKFSKTVFGVVHRKFGGSLETLVAGGAALDVAVGNDFKTLGFEVLEGFGMTEAAPMITFTRPGRVRIGSPGESMPDVKIQIKDGEIIASGPNIMQGYYNSPEATAEVLKNGWLYTGDLGHIDKDGYLYITGRKKEIIVLSNGKNVNPVELENKLLESSLVKDCGVFFENDQLQAIILPNRDSLKAFEGRTADDILRWELIEPFNREVSAYKKIMRIHLTDEELPRTRLGKLQHFKLSDLITKEHASDESLPVFDNAEYKIIAEYLEKEKGQRVMPSHHLEMDIGMDSLDKVGFEAWLAQTFGIDMPPQKMVEFVNLAQLAEYVSDKKTRIEEGEVNWGDIMQEKLELNLPRTWSLGSIAFRLSRHLLQMYFRFTSKGVDNIPDGPCIIAPNHQSSFDGLFVASVMRTNQIKETYFYAKEEHFKQSFLKYLAARNNIIIVNLNLELKKSIQSMAEVLRQNKKLIIFPEGTRTLNGELGHFKKTFAILAAELQVPVVPVVIEGAFKALPKGSRFPRMFTPVKVEFLPPVNPEGETYDSLTGKVKDQIQKKL